MGSDQNLVNNLLSKLSTTFKIMDLGELGFFFEIETVKCDDGILLSQQRYMPDILKRAGMTDCKPLATPISVLKSVPLNADLYDDPTQYKSLAGALQYLTVTQPDLSFTVNQLCQHMHAPTVSHWGTEIKQKTVARSSTEAEYKSLADVCAEVIWILSLLREINAPNIHVLKL
ncbi:PREDICTED: uncharacterized protein LOC109171521 [Ipomoea nil]|uniref:uncharacterized protein LOC109171521 n=1 Tax=Ipomoea nil TaxID=35883 RepID=UPI0009014A4E|nr:PREDICTED: uncharacterized protein LOC109171521 [Ipomoea nil]